MTRARDILIILMAIGWALTALQSCGREKALLKASVELSDERSRVAEYKDAMGRIRHEVEELEVTHALLMQAKDSMIQAMRADHGRKVKALQSRTAIVIEKRDTVAVEVMPGDSADGPLTFLHVDDWITIAGEIMPGSVRLDYGVRVGLDVDRKWQRPGFMRPKEVVVDIRLHDPAATLVTARTVTIKPDPTPWWATRAACAAGGFIAGMMMSR